MESVWLPHVRSPEDSWVGVTDVTKRKRLQSRLAQRSRRAKKAQAKELETLAGTTFSKSTTSTNGPPDAPIEPRVTPMQNIWDYSVPVAFDLLDLEPYDSELSLLGDFSDFYHTSNLPCPAPPISPEIAETTKLPPYSLLLHSHNATAALWRNADMLHISCASPSFFFLEPEAEPFHSLVPTSLQNTIIHLPYIDVLPFPAMRDRILRALAIIDQDDLRRDLIDSGLRCWGRSTWDSRGWELQEGFTEKWWFLLDEEIIHLTNWWRTERGDNPLIWKGRRQSPRFFEVG